MTLSIVKLNNGDANLDFVEAYVNSAALTAQDRLNRTRRTLAGVDQVLDVKVAEVEAKRVVAFDQITDIVASTQPQIDAVLNGLNAEAATTETGQNRAAAEAAAVIATSVAVNVQSSSRTAATWAVLSTLAPGSIGEGAEVLDSDAGTHADPSTSVSVSNAGRYTAYALTTGAWTRIGATGLAGKADKATFLDANIPKILPTLGEWKSIATDVTGRFMRGVDMLDQPWHAVGSVIVPAPKSEGLMIRDAIATARALVGDGSYFSVDDGGALTFYQRLTATTQKLILAAPKDSAAGSVQVVPLIGEWAWIKQDLQGRPMQAEDLSGKRFVAVSGVLVPDQGAGGSTGTGAALKYAYDYLTGTACIVTVEGVDYLILVTGQSLAEGSTTEPSEVTLSTTAEYPGFALMPTPGPLPLDVPFTSYADLHEVPLAGGPGKETICSGMADALMRRFQATLGFKPRIIFGVAAKGASMYSDYRFSDRGLKKGSLTFNRLMAIVEQCHAISKAQGRRLVVPLCVISQGESAEETQPQYERELDQWQPDIETGVRRITGQVEPVPIYITQTNRPQGAMAVPVDCVIPNAQLQSQQRNPRIRFVGPNGQYRGSADNAHPLPASYRCIGNMVGNFIARDFFGPGFEALRVRDAYWISSTQFALRYTQPIALETDDSKVTISTLGAGKGVGFTDGTGSPPAVMGVSAAGDTITVTLASAPTGRRPRAFVASQATGVKPDNVDGLRSGIRSAASYDTEPLTGTVQYWWAATQTINLY